MNKLFIKFLTVIYFSLEVLVKVALIIVCAFALAVAAKLFVQLFLNNF